MKVKDIVKRLKAEGWTLARQKGSHRQFVKPGHPGIVTVSGRDNEQPYVESLRRVFQQAGWDWKER